ncbi:LytTR family transcriptional regulator DNA-binding domain-containing protein [Phaeocystidibacter marisrubri]
MEGCQTFVFLRIGASHFRSVKFSDIVLIESDQPRKLKIYFKNESDIKSEVIRKTLSKISDELPNCFWRINRKTIVNSKHVNTVSDKFDYVQVGSLLLDVGPSFRSKLRAILNVLE